MTFDEQLAGIFIKNGGCTILLLGATYSDEKLTFSSAAKASMSTLSHGNYQDVIISGSCDMDDHLQIKTLTPC